MQEMGMIERPQALGAVGDEGLYVTKFTVEEDPSLMSYLGLQDRAKIAQLFPRPLTWDQYCRGVSISGCNTPDATAQRAPQTAEEQDRYHVPGLYRGHFRPTQENDCVLFPDTCTGHVGDFPCAWGSLLQPWIYHFHLPLSSGGTIGSTNAYTNHQIMELWDAANATRSNLMTLWYTPEGLYSKYIGTPTQMMRISMPPPTQECMEYRVDHLVATT